MIRKGGRRDIFLGTRECQGYVEPCVFGEGDGFYDQIPRLDFGVMYHGITYADEAYSKETEGHMTINLWHPVMKHGVIEFPKPQDCAIHRIVKEMSMKSFGEDNFSGLKEFEEVR